METSREEETPDRSVHHSSGAEAPAQADLRILAQRSGPPDSDLARLSAFLHETDYYYINFYS